MKHIKKAAAAAEAGVKSRTQFSLNLEAGKNPRRCSRLISLKTSKRGEKSKIKTNIWPLALHTCLSYLSLAPHVKLPRSPIVLSRLIKRRRRSKHPPLPPPGSAVAGNDRSGVLWHLPGETCSPDHPPLSLSFIIFFISPSFPFILPLFSPLSKEAAKGSGGGGCQRMRLYPSAH